MNDGASAQAARACRSPLGDRSRTVTRAPRVQKPKAMAAGPAAGVEHAFAGEPGRVETGETAEEGRHLLAVRRVGQRMLAVRQVRPLILEARERLRHAIGRSRRVGRCPGSSAEPAESRPAAHLLPGHPANGIARLLHGGPPHLLRPHLLHLLARAARHLVEIGLGELGAFWRRNDQMADRDAVLDELDR